MIPQRTLQAAWICVVVAAFLGGCNKKQADVAPAAPPAIPVSQPITRQVTDYIDFTGRTEAKDSVSIVPRVTGYLVSMPFKEGAEVKAGDVLFEIDPRPYQAQYDQAAGQVLLNKARVKEAVADNLRAKELAKDAGRDQPSGSRSLSGGRRRDGGRGAGRQGEPGNLQAESGILQRPFADRWAGQPLLSHARQPGESGSNAANRRRFGRSDVRLLRRRRDDAAARAQGDQRRTIERYQQGEIPVYISLEGEDNFPHKGIINFVNNRVNSGTGSITVRGVIRQSEARQTEFDC